MQDAQELNTVRGWVAAAQRIVVLTGAGISTDSGIPDFRGPQGLWTRNPAAEKQSTLQNYLADAEVRKAAWRARLVHPAWTAQPNRGHLALVALEQQGRLHALITQNIDELHRIAGNDPARIIEVHGTIRRVICWGCGARAPMEAALERVRAGEADPACLECDGILKSDTISFGQALVPQTIARALRVAAEADLFLAIGSTLQVNPVAGVVPVAQQAGARLIILNDQATAFDHLADAVLRGPIGEWLPAICDARIGPPKRGCIAAATGSRSCCRSHGFRRCGAGA